MPSIDIAANTRAAQREVKDLSGALDGVSDSLDDLARDAQRTGTSTDHDLDRIGTGAKEAGRDVESAGERIERSFRELQQASEKTQRNVSSDAKRAGDDLSKGYRHAGDDGAESFGRIKDGAGEVTTEIGQNLGEAVSSFRGDLSDLGQVGQDSLGGLAASIAGAGPAGLVGAIGLAAGAAGLGLLTGKLQEAAEKQEEINDLASSMAESYESGTNGSIDAMVLFGAVQDQINGNYDEVKKNAEDWGVTTSVAARAMSGDLTALSTVQESVNRKSAEYTDVLKTRNATGEETWHDTMDLTKAQKELRDQVHAGTESLSKYQAASERGREQSAATASALYDVAVQSGKATRKVDDLGNKIVKLPDGTEVVVNAKTHKAYEDLDALEKKKKQALADHTTVVRIGVDDSALRGYRPPAVIGETWVNIRGRNATWQ